MSEPYDCTADVSKHKRKVEHWMRGFSNIIMGRAVVHDDSKLRDPEKQCFDKWTPELKRRVFGSDEYKNALVSMGDGLKHHYKANRHHPEHYPNGVDGMTLHDIVEMLCDWMAVAEEKGSHVDLDYLKQRFNLSDQLVSIFVNTLRDEDFSNRCDNVPVADFTPPDKRTYMPSDPDLSKNG